MSNYLPTDHELIRAALLGDSLCFDTLFSRYRPELLVMLRQKCSREDDAQDILQDTFVKSYLNLRRFDFKYTFGQWVYTIARNQFIDFTRRRRDLPVITDLYADMNAPYDGMTPEESVISEQSGTQLDGILLQLPENYRRIAELRFWREYSYEEIALELDLPISTVKTQIRRSRARLCKLIEND